MMRLRLEGLLPGRQRRCHGPVQAPALPQQRGAPWVEGKPRRDQHSPDSCSGLCRSKTPWPCGQAVTAAGQHYLLLAPKAGVPLQAPSPPWRAITALTCSAELPRGALKLTDLVLLCYRKPQQQVCLVKPAPAASTVLFTAEVQHVLGSLRACGWRMHVLLAGCYQHVCAADRNMLISPT